METDLKVWNEILAMYGPMSNGNGKTPSNLSMDDLIRQTMEQIAKSMEKRLFDKDAKSAPPTPTKRVPYASLAEFPAAPVAQVKCACGCNEFVTPSLRWGAYAGAAHMMRAARLAEREAFGADAPPLKLLSEKDPKASRELELIDTIAATKTAADNQIGSLNDALAEKERRIRELERAVFRPVDYSKPMGTAPTYGRTFAHLRETERAQQATGTTAVAQAPVYTHPRAIRPLPAMLAGRWSAPPKPVTIACQSEDDFPFAYVED